MSCRFNPIELSFLAEYVAVMTPVAKALNIMQTEADVHMGWLVPTIALLTQKLERLRLSSKLCQPLINAILAGIEQRFSQMLADPEMIAAAILLPKFRTSWTSNEDVLKAGKFIFFKALFAFGHILWDELLLKVKSLNNSKYVFLYRFGLHQETSGPGSNTKVWQQLYVIRWWGLLWLHEGPCPGKYKAAGCLLNQHKHCIQCFEVLSYCVQSVSQVKYTFTCFCSMRETFQYSWIDLLSQKSTSQFKKLWKSNSFEVEP